MALQRLTLSQIETAILECLHYSSSAVAPWSSSANLYLRVNDYVQRLPVIAAAASNVMRLKSGKDPLKGVPRFMMWRTQGQMKAASGESLVYFPEDYDVYISFYDETNKRELNEVTDVNRYHPRLKLKVSGPPEAIEIMGALPAQSSAVYQKYAILYPATEAGITPNITIDYWRVPRKMPGSSATTEYPDVDPKYEMLAVYGPAADLGRIYGRDADKWKAAADELISELAMTAVVM